MGWFNEQIKQRLKADDKAFSDTFVSIAEVVMKSKVCNTRTDFQHQTKDAISRVLTFYQVKPSKFPKDFTDLNRQLEFLLRPFGMMYRSVELEGSWYQDATGAFLGTLKTGGVVALLPQKMGGYTFFDYEKSKTIKLNKQTASLLENTAFSFYRPFPQKQMKIRDLLQYIASILTPIDMTMIIGFALCVFLLELMLPKLNNILFSEVLENSNYRLFFAVATMLITINLSRNLMNTVRSILMDRIQAKTNVMVEAASMMRILSLPAQFFGKYSSGELSSRIKSINGLCTKLCDVILNTGLRMIAALLYVTQIFYYAPSLMIPSITIILITSMLTLFSTFEETRLAKQLMEITAKESGLVYSLITGIQKLKLAGAEKRMFSRWGSIYKQKAQLVYNKPLFIKLNPVIFLGISSIGMIVLYYMAAKSGVSTADYFSFNVAYSIVLGSLKALSMSNVNVAEIRSIFEIVKPILEAVPEMSPEKKMLTRLKGSIELSCVSFRYNNTMPLIVNKLTLKIRHGQYVALVGKTGCGKSTLFRLLLGFETPQKGAIYYDGQDMSNLDLKSLRENIGAVLQNSKLIPGDIFSNITISAPWLTLADAWEAAKLAGIDQDILNMPMGMHTMIGVGSGGVSGGQKQRLLIARAIATKPRILLFDEATSALDNITQKIVVNSLKSLSCTRIVIAHRLSTIQQCDRIIVLDQGQIIEDGNYSELIQKNGYFSQLVELQRLET